MLPSDRHQLTNKIAELEQQLDSSYASNNRRLNRLILLAEFLTNDQKDKLLELVWEK